MNRKLVFVFGVLGATLFIVPSILGGLWIEDYSFISQYISESFATGVPNAQYLHYMYITSGLLLFVFSLMAPSFLSKSKGIRIGFVLFGLLYGLGNVTVALFPCDAGCPTDIETSSIAQLIHNVSAFFTYAIVPFCLIGIGLSLKKKLVDKNLQKITIICGILALTFVVILFGDPKGPYIGLFQRIIEASILFWVVYMAFFLRRVQTDRI